jgi:hypothetical protein
MKRTLWDKFASKLETIEDAPESHRMAFLNVLHADDVVRSLVFSPVHKTLGTLSPATLLAITDKGWIFVSGEEDEFVSSVRCNYAETLLLELTVVLLLGVLKVDFKTEDGTQCISIAFNLVTLKYYQEAIKLLLDGVEGACVNVEVTEAQAKLSAKSIPAKSQGDVFRLKPSMQQIMDAAYWLSIFGGRACWLQYELSSEIILVLTERELICVSEETIWRGSQKRKVDREGHIITYFPLSRLETYRFEPGSQAEKLKLEIRTRHGGRTLAIEFLREKESEVDSFMKQIKQQQQSTIQFPDKTRNAPL